MKDDNNNAMIFPDEQPFIEKLRLTRRCQTEISETSRFFADLSEDRFGALAQRLIQAGESKTLGILMNIAAVVGVKLPPAILAETLKVIDPLTDFYVPYRVQDASAILPLLAVVETDGVSGARQAFGAMIAAELCLKHGGERTKVLKVLKKLSLSAYSSEAKNLVSRGLKLLELEEKEPDSPRPSLAIAEDPLQRLPQERPPVVIGGDFSVRRPIPKIGRNDPCHCGSGKKYKKCCYEKDQEVLRDASPYEGLTMTQVRSQPRLVEDADIIERMNPYELKELAPSSLNEDQLLVAYRQLDLFGLHEHAFDMLLELKNRPGQDEFALGHMEDLLHAAIDAGKTGLARRIMDLIPEKMLFAAEEARLSLNIMERANEYKDLEEMARKGIVKGGEEEKWNDPLLNMSYTFENKFPALSIVFARAAMLGNPEKIIDNEALLDVVRQGRAECDLSPWDDPAEAYFDWTLEKTEENKAEENRSHELEELNAKLRTANELARQRMRELQEKERELEALTRNLQTIKTAPPDHRLRKREEPVANGEAEREIIGRLRNQVNNLKADIRERQQEHQALRRQLQEERTRLSKQPSDPPLSGKSDLSDEDEGLPLEYGRGPWKILVPAYSPAFLKACEHMPSPVVAKALRSLASFATHDETIWRQTRRLERLCDIYRIRIDLTHRLLIAWKEDVELKVLDLILRRDLEHWIKQYARSA